MPDTRPNILIFNPDQWRGDVLGHMGNPAAHTPNFDSLVSEDAVSFRNAFCQNPVCTPSRCSFMTGWYPHTRGHRTMFHMLQPGEPMLLRTLKENGYFVWWGGKNDVVPAQNGYNDYCDTHYDCNAEDKPLFKVDQNDPSWRGDSASDSFYSFYYGQRDHSPGLDYTRDSDSAFVEGAIDFILNPPPDAEGRPLCIYLPIGKPHPPYMIEAPWFDLIDRAALPQRISEPDWSTKPAMLRRYVQRQNMHTWDDARWDELRAVYYGMVARVDDQFGRIVAALKQANMYDNTAIFAFSDHGDFTGDYGLVEKTQNTFEDCLSRVPFIIKPPAGVPCQAGVRDALVELVDFPATVEAVTGIAPAHTHFGRSLLPLIAGDKDQHREAVFCQGGRLHGEYQAMEKVPGFGPEKLYWARVGVQHFEGAEHTKATMCRTQDYKYVHRLYEPDELYDLKSDPHELVNRADDPEFAPVLEMMQMRLMYFYLETSDNVPHAEDRRW